MKQDTNMEHSAEWYRGAVAVIGRMVDECQTVFDSDLPHITQGNLEDYLAEYAELLAAAEAREAALEKHEIAAYLEWQGKDGIKCGTFQPSEEGPREPTYTTTVREWRKLVARAEAREAGEPSAADVIREAKAALEMVRQYICTHHITYLDRTPDGDRLRAMKHEAREYVESGKHLEALATITAWEAGNVQG